MKSNFCNSDTIYTILIKFFTSYKFWNLKKYIHI